MSYILISIALILFSAFILVKKKMKLKVSKIDQTKEKAVTVKDIPKHHHFQMWVPKIVDGLYTIHLLKKDGVKIFEQWAKMYGPIFEFSIVNEKVYGVQDPMLIQKILGSSNVHLLNKPKTIYHLIMLESLQGGLLANEVNVWASHRKVALQTFAYKNYRTFAKIINRQTEELLSSLISCSSDTVSVDGRMMTDLLYSHTIKIISEVVAGSSSDTGTNSSDFHRHTKEIQKLFAYRLYHPETMIPILWWLNPIRKKYDYHVDQHKKHIFNDYTRCLRQIHAAEIEYSATSEKQNNAEVLKTKDECENDGFTPFIEEMIKSNGTWKEIYDEVGTFLAAGHETTVNAVQLLLQHLGENLAIQSKCQQEIDDIFDQKANLPNGKTIHWNYLSLDDIRELKYLHRCVLESLRLTPTVPIFLRQLSSPMEIDKFKFPHGTIFAFLPWAVHRNPQDYPNPEIFDPDRFLPEEVAKRHPYSYIPFSQGPRGCIGMKFGIMEMKVIMAWILRHFDIHTSDRFQEMKFLFEISNVPERDFKITLTKRKYIDQLRLVDKIHCS